MIGLGSLTNTYLDIQKKEKSENGGKKSEKYSVISLDWKQDRVGFFTFIHHDTRDPGQYDRKLKKSHGDRKRRSKVIPLHRGIVFT